VAPEVIELEPATTASDIWSLACTVIELLTGVPPYFDNTAMSALYKMVNEEHPPLPERISPVSITIRIIQEPSITIHTYRNWKIFY